MRFVRIDEETWSKAMARAHREGTTMSARIREFVDEYANDDMSISREIALIMVRLRRIRKRLTIGE